MKKLITIKSFFSVSTILVAALGLLICLGFKLLVFDPIYQSALSETNNTVISLRNNFETVFLSNRKNAEQICYSTLVQNYFSLDDPIQRFWLNKDVDELLSVIVQQDDEIMQISVLMPDGSCQGLYYKREIPYEAACWMEKQTEQGVSFMNVSDDAFPQFYCLNKTIVNTQLGEHYGERIASLLILYRSNVLREMMEQLRYNEKNFLAVVDRESRVVMSIMPELTGTVLDTTGGYQSEEILDTGYRIVNSRIINATVNDLEYLFRFILIVFFLLFLLQVFLYLLLNHRLLKPIRCLSEEIANIDYQNLDSVFRSENVTELAIIESALNQMLCRIKNMSKRIVENQEKLYEMELLKQKSTLSALLSQINPHFLYNCFECINGIAAEYHCPEIITISTALAKMFRYSIKEKTYVFLQQEIEIVEEYIAIMKIKFPDKFTVSYDFDEELLDWRVLKMLLQPVVENAFKHGLTALEGHGVLKISGKRETGRIVLAVEDNGIGIEEEKLGDIKHQLRTSDKKGNGIGLSNIDQRIKLCYGAEYGLSIESCAGEGTTVKISLPDNAIMSLEQN